MQGIWAQSYARGKYSGGTVVAPPTLFRSSARLLKVLLVVVCKAKTLLLRAFLTVQIHTHIHRIYRTYTYIDTKDIHRYKKWRREKLEKRKTKKMCGQSCQWILFDAHRLASCGCLLILPPFQDSHPTWTRIPLLLLLLSFRWLLFLFFGSSLPASISYIFPIQVGIFFPPLFFCLFVWKLKLPLVSSQWRSHFHCHFPIPLPHSHFPPEVHVPVHVRGVEVPGKKLALKFDLLVTTCSFHKQNSWTPQQWCLALSLQQP